MRGLGTNHEISGPITGLEEKKLHPMAQTDKHTDGHGNSMTESANWADSVKTTLEK